MPTISSHPTLQSTLKAHCHHLRELITNNEVLAYEIESRLHIKPAENHHYWATAASSRAGLLDKTLHLLRDEQIDELWVDQLEERVEAAARWVGVLKELNGEMREEVFQLKKWRRREEREEEKKQEKVEDEKEAEGSREEEEREG